MDSGPLEPDVVFHWTTDMRLLDHSHGGGAVDGASGETPTLPAARGPATVLLGVSICT